MGSPPRARCTARYAIQNGVPARVEEPPDLGALVHFLRGHGIMVQKLPEQLELVDGLPRNPTGKVLKHELRERLALRSPPR